jgi:hypothetical protein
MATYKGIKGFSIQNLSADPSNPIEGEIWYNSTSNVWKVEEATAAGAWATANNMNNARSSLGGAGIQTAALAFGGSQPSPINSTLTEEYDGTSWAGSGGLGTGRRGLAGCGIQTAGLAFGGYVTGFLSATEEYNGSTWSPGNPLINARSSSIGAGTQTAGLAWGGDEPNPPGPNK